MSKKIKDALLSGIIQRMFWNLRHYNDLYPKKSINEQDLIEEIKRVSHKYLNK